MLDLRVPDRAAVSEAVDLVRAHAPAAGGFVNAILRRLGREGPRALPDPERQPLAWLTSAGSLPTWLAERWLARLGPQAAVARATALLEKPATTVRLNPRFPDATGRVAQAGITLRPLTLAGAFEASGPSAVPLAEEGVLYLQDEGSQVVGHLASTPGRILDACAAPGGKAMLMADLGADRVVYAGEPGARRRDSMARLVARWRSQTLRIVGADARRPPFPDACFDSVLLDAPCSGLGTLGRHPDIRWRTKATDPARHARLQSTLLASLAPLVRPEGQLVYATCSSEPEENDAVVERFLAESPAWRLEAPPAWARPFAVGSHVRTDRQGVGDAFFAALLRRA
jgi:16S rRNA (cytosine967-C5)-methyltransferase